MEEVNFLSLDGELEFEWLLFLYVFLVSFRLVVRSISRLFADRSLNDSSFLLPEDDLFLFGGEYDLFLVFCLGEGTGDLDLWLLR